MSPVIVVLRALYTFPDLVYILVIRLAMSADACSCYLL